MSILRKDMPQRGKCWWVIEQGDVIHNDKCCGRSVKYTVDKEDGRKYESFCPTHKERAEELEKQLEFLDEETF